MKVADRKTFRCTGLFRFHSVLAKFKKLKKMLKIYRKVSKGLTNVFIYI